MDEMKIANVIPHFKYDDQELLGNYKRVSLLCSLSKVLEKIMNNRLTEFLNSHPLLFSYRFGFSKKVTFHLYDNSHYDRQLNI